MYKPQWGIWPKQYLSKQGRLLDGEISRDDNGQEPPIRAGSHPVTWRSARTHQMEQLWRGLFLPIDFKGRWLAQMGTLTLQTL